MTPYIKMLLAIHDHEKAEREGRLPSPKEPIPEACAACGNTKNLTFQEDPDIYDGICIWHCPCGARTDRFTGKQLS